MVMQRVQNKLNQLLEIEVSSNKMLFLLIPQVYIFWLFAVFLIMVNNKQTRIFAFVLSILFAVLFSLWMTFWLITKVSQTSLPFNDILGIISLGLTLLASVFYALLTLSFENKNIQNLASNKISIFDFFVRFFLIVNWVYGIWGLQRIFKEYYLLDSTKNNPI